MLAAVLFPWEAFVEFNRLNIAMYSEYKILEMANHLLHNRQLSRKLRIAQRHSKEKK